MQTEEWLTSTQTALESQEFGKAIKICTHEFLETVTPTSDALKRLGEFVDHPDRLDGSDALHQMASTLEESILRIIITSKPVHMCTVIIELAGGQKAPKIQTRQSSEIQAAAQFELSTQGGADLTKYLAVVKGGIYTAIQRIRAVLDSLEPPPATLDEFTQTLHLALVDFHKCITSMSVALHIFNN